MHYQITNWQWCMHDQLVSWLSAPHSNLNVESRCSLKCANTWSCAITNPVATVAWTLPLEHKAGSRNNADASTHHSLQMYLACVPPDEVFVHYIQVISHSDKSSPCFIWETLWLFKVLHIFWPLWLGGGTIFKGMPLLHNLK